jgi:putative phage-type endonuclease
MTPLIEIISILPGMPDSAIQEIRRGFIGASDIAAIMGLSPYATPLSVYNAKVHGSNWKGNRDTRYGKLKEHAILAGAVMDMVEEEGVAGVSWKPNANIYVHECGHLSATPDGFITWADGTVSVMEAKSVRSSSRGQWEAGPPEHYLWQVQQQMLCTGLESALVCVLIDSADPRRFLVRADPDAHARIIEVGRAFWERVESRNPPEPVTAEEAEEAYPLAIPAMQVEATPEIAAAVDELARLKADAKSIKEGTEELQARIHAHMGEAEILTSENTPIYRWFNKGADRVDTKRLQAEAPDIYAQYLRRSEWREGKVLR